jgi:hypothetical protein
MVVAHRSTTSHVCLIGLLSTVLTGPAGADTAALSVNEVTMTAGDIGEVIVSGEVNKKDTFGVTVLVEIVPRAGNIGTVVFTPAPPVDIVPLGRPWGDDGMFSPYDTNAIAFSSTKNGSVDDNGTYLSSGLTFVGSLVIFPVQASPDAQGVWDVKLSTSIGDSGWEELDTTLSPGTITVTPSPDIPTLSEWGMAVLALLVLTAGTLILRTKEVRLAA